MYDNRLSELTKYRHFDSGVCSARWVLEYNSVRSRVCSFGVLHHQ